MSDPMANTTSETAQAEAQRLANLPVLSVRAMFVAPLQTFLLR